MADPKEPESEEKPQKSLNEKQQVSRCSKVFIKVTVPYLISLHFQAKWEKDVIQYVMCILFYPSS